MRLLFVFILFYSVHSFAQSLNWAQQIGGSSFDQSYSVAIDQGDNVVTVGLFVGTIDLDPGPGIFSITSSGSHDIFIQKLTLSGQFLWGGRLGGSGAEAAPRVFTDLNDDIYVAGDFSGTVDFNIGSGVSNMTSTAKDVFLVKMSSTGSYLWSKSIGGTTNDQAHDVTCDVNGNVFVTGNFGNSMDMDPGAGVHMVSAIAASDVFIWALGPTGAFLWGKVIGGAGNDVGRGIDTDAAGNVLVTGVYESVVDLDPGVTMDISTSQGGDDIFLIKLSSSGIYQWGIGIGGNSAEESNDIAVDSQGACIITGRMTSPTDIDPSANTVNLVASGFEDSYLVKYSSAGILEWGFLFQSFLNQGFGVDTDAQDNIYTIGTFGALGTNTLDMDPSSSNAMLSGIGAGDIYVGAYSTNGVYQWAFQLGGNSNDDGFGIDVSANGAMAICGSFYQAMDADPSSFVLNLSGTWDEGFTCLFDVRTCENISVSANVILEGPYDVASSLMKDDLRLAGLIPLTEPYSALGYLVDDPQPLPLSVLNVAGVNAIVDWIILELRDANNSTVVLETKAALLQRDGDVVSTDGVSPVAFCSPTNDYYVAVRHRNHLGVMTANTVALSTTMQALDITSSNTALYGTNGRKELITNTWGLWQGNVSNDGALKYIGVNNDRDPILTAVGGSTPTATLVAYSTADGNLDGFIKYTGTNNDRDPILLNVGGSVPTATRIEQLP